jgi:hypothetical protein
LAFQSKGSIIAFLSDSLTVVRGLEAPDFPFPIVDKGQLRGVFILSGNSKALVSDAGWVPLGDRHRKRLVASMVAADDHGPEKTRFSDQWNRIVIFSNQIRIMPVCPSPP